MLSSPSDGYGAVPPLDPHAKSSQYDQKNPFIDSSSLPAVKLVSVSCKVVTIFVFIIALCMGSFFIHKVAVSQSEVQETFYDFIIVGAGPGGSVLAEKLSADLSIRVLLLEAGGASQFELGGQDYLSSPLTSFDIPLLWPSVSHMSQYHWEVEDRTSEGTPNALIAKAMGGCGIHNAMLYVRAIEEDFEHWNMDGWTWEMAYEKYKAIENFDPSAGGRIDGELEVPDWHGSGGPISSSPPLWVDEITPYFVSSCAALGIPTVDDFNAPGSRYGAGMYTFAIKKGIRDSAARAMLGPIISGKVIRPNLTILPESEVISLISENHEAQNESDSVKLDVRGVKYARFGITYEAKLDRSGTEQAKLWRSVVIAGGALNTPKILMTSGIGDKKDLESRNIDCLVDIPGVGKNLQDHPALGLMFEAKEMLMERYPSAYKVAQDLESYKLNVMRALDLEFPEGITFTGILEEETVPEWASPFGLFASAGLTSGAFLKSGLSDDDIPDIQLTVFPQVTEPHIEVLNHTRPVDPDIPAILITIALLRPEGRKTIKLNENDPIFGPPHIDFDESLPVLSDFDIDRLAWAILKVLEIQKQAPLQDVTGTNLTPGMNENMTDEEIKQWIKDHVYNNSHWCGTAKMGNLETDSMAVVDEKLRVKNVNNLRIGDASVIPYIPHGNVHSTIVLIGSHGADMVLEEKLAIS